ncbi:Beta-1,3-n-acetylglucosaminyltransferase radical fringe isoform 1 [Hibiscus syriacus]|uniref:non-specific serine/threonine protein kinase n=1 Tax=Hibiscus syriacus TaxID=106335 RepID=A0A6A3A658_HIBSY|nr:Beta-1,3-n-acetylglucosaminyltransferase radical fringe isoform 1 [Hibiscus syriacus]
MVGSLMFESLSAGADVVGTSHHIFPLLLPIIILIPSSPLTFCVAYPAIFYPPTAVPTPSLTTTRLSFHPELVILVIVSLVSLLSLLLAMGFLSKFLKRRKPTAVRGGADEEKGRDLGVEEGKGFVKRFRWNEIKDSTKDFSRLIGRGGFSNVYLANLSGSTLGAVKIYVGNDRLNQSFRQELDILTQIQHDNIVKFLGYCDDQEEGAMVLEYVPNGNLQEKLHGNGRELLPWKTRMSIAFQLAEAIEYLHDKCSLQIAHGDIKASNILLDERFNCKLCDFGSAKMGFSSKVVPPKTKQIMLVTGMEPFCPEREQLLTTMVAPKLREVVEDGGGAAEMVDPKLGGEFELEEGKAMLLIVELCLQKSSTVRPSAAEIMQTMKNKIGSVGSRLLPPAKERHC